MARSKSSHKWLKEHFDDIYVKEAQKLGYRSRAAFKLLELQEKDKIIRSGMNVVDLGAAPGGWSQIAAKLVGKKGHVYALDILPMQALENVTFIEGDFQEQSVLDELLNKVSNQPIDLVLSDMAPNISGMKAIDQPRAIYLAELALDCAKSILSPGGSFAVKVFQGEGFDEYLYDLKRNFAKVVSRKPKASRARSNEIYLVAKTFKKCDDN